MTPGAGDDVPLRLFSFQAVRAPSTRPPPGRSMAHLIYLKVDLRVLLLSSTSNQFSKIWPERIRSSPEFHLG